MSATKSVRSPRDRRGVDNELSPRSRKKEAHRSATLESDSPKALSPRAKGVAPSQPRKLHKLSNSNSGDESSGEEVYTHGMLPGQISLMLQNKSSGDTMSIFDGEDSQPDEDDAFCDEYKFEIQPHAVEAYKTYRIMTAGSSEARVQKYAAVLSPSLTGHKDDE